MSESKLKYHRTSSVVVPCSKVGDLNQGPQFIIPTPTSDFFVDVQVVSSSSQSAAGTTSYLSYNPVTGFIQIGVAGPENIDVTQVYSVVLINRATGAASDPVFFTAKIFTCTMFVVGPKSFSVCIGIGTPYLQQYTGVSYTACNSELLINGVKWNAVDPLTGAAVVPGPGPGTLPDTAFCPFVTAFTPPGDDSKCYIFDRNSENPVTFARGSAQSQCSFDRCVTPATGAANRNFYTQEQLNAFAASIGLPNGVFVAGGPGGLNDAVGCPTTPPNTLQPKGGSFCNTCLAIPASIPTTGPGAVTRCDASSTFTQTLTMVGNAPSFQNGIISGITVTYDSTCNTLGAFNITC
ncbi:hypothetical protein BV898_18168 [Hypsibius exemplaris]|uniref:Uncharacterized protein n=1 Tax=Hypsibius exemplaris TaxID=2072580 RepID=A0A9X6NJA5_HYPEX|nr:hypothetical protein BV898_18168 [Hypsibius exemplaris]